MSMTSSSISLFVQTPGYFRNEAVISEYTLATGIPVLQRALTKCDPVRCTSGTIL